VAVIQVCFEKKGKSLAPAAAASQREWFRMDLILGVAHRAAQHGAQNRQTAAQNQQD